MPKVEMYYKGINGIVRFDERPIFYDDNNLFDYSHGFDLINMPNGRSSRIHRITSFAQTYEITLQIIGNNKKEVLDMLHDTFEKDINNYIKTGQLAKLYVGDSYLECLLSSNSYSKWNKMDMYENIKIQVLAPKPKWTIDEEFTYQKIDYEEEELDEKALRIPTLIPFWITQEKGIRYLSNNSIGETLAKITIFGAISKPTLYIGDNTYRIHEELLENERIEIDQRNKTIIKITGSGERVNVFHLRDKEHSVFKPIPEGENSITQNDDFSYTIVLYHERNEPKWT